MMENNKKKSFFCLLGTSMNAFLFQGEGENNETEIVVLGDQAEQVTEVFVLGD